MATKMQEFESFTKDDEVEYTEETAEKIQRVMEAWFNAFAESPEFDALTEEQQENAAFVIQTFSTYIYSYTGEIPPCWSSSGLRETCLHTLPRKISAEEDYYQALAPVLNAFFLFAHGKGWLRQGDTLARAVSDLRVDIVRNGRDPRHWGMAKSFIMGGKQAGYDMSTREGINSFMVAHNASRLTRPACDKALHVQPVGTQRIVARQPSRNAPCPCGSGRKFKGCCGRTKPANA
jgi:hypothetical protein